jgi:hypothetical protein
LSPEITDEERGYKRDEADEAATRHAVDSAERPFSQRYHEFL